MNVIATAKTIAARTRFLLPAAALRPINESSSARCQPSTVFVMNDDWRLRIELGEEREARELARRLHDFDREHDLSLAFGDRVVVSRDGADVFCYAANREQTEAAERAIRSLAAESG